MTFLNNASHRNRVISVKLHLPFPVSKSWLFSDARSQTAGIIPNLYHDTYTSSKGKKTDKLSIVKPLGLPFFLI